MASLLRQIVAGPRAKHQETGLDLCYVTPNIIVTSGPSQTYPQRAYRNPLDRLVTYLDTRHGADWAVWEFRAEGTGYPDAAVHGRVRHFPWPDHHPPPFGLVPGIVGGMRAWLGGAAWEYGDIGEGGGGNGEVVKGALGAAAAAEGREAKERVVVVHCKAGKGRSGTMVCSYLIAEEGWGVPEALARFQERRMRPGFGAGVSIPSQLRWVGYVERWAKKGGKRYVDRPVEIVEVHVWGLRNGVKVEVEGFVEEGRKIQVFHTFKGAERIVVEAGAPGGGGIMDMVQDMAGYGAKGEDKDEAATDGSKNSSRENLSRSSSKKSKGSPRPSLGRKLSGGKQGSSQSLNKLGTDAPRSKVIVMPEGSPNPSSGGASLPGKDEPRSQSTASLPSSAAAATDTSEPGGRAVIFKPATPILIPNSDINIAVERRSRGPASLGLTMVTAVAHVWFNTFFEGNGPEQDGQADESGVFEIEWDKMDGIKGSSQRGTRALDRLSVIWRVAGSEGKGPAAPGVAINEPREGSPIPQAHAADWKGGNNEDPTAERRLGLRVEDPESQGVSKASSVRSSIKGEDGGEDRASLEGVRVSGPGGEEALDETGPPARAPKP